MKWESELLSAKQKNGIHGPADTRTGRVLDQRIEIQSSQHRHWEGENCPETAAITTLYISANIDPFIFGWFRGPEVCNSRPISLKVIMHNFSILWHFLRSQSLSFPKTLSLHPLTFSRDLRPWFKDQMHVLMLMVHPLFSFSISWTLVTDCFVMGLSVHGLQAREAFLWMSRKLEQWVWLWVMGARHLCGRRSVNWNGIFKRRNWGFNLTLTT